MSDINLSKSITINAPAEKVWEAITNPDLVEKYFFGTRVDSDWQVGSPIIFRGEWEGKVYEDKGIIIKCVPHKTLQFSYWSNFSGDADSPENYSQITYDLVEKNGQTTLTISQNNVKSETAKADSEKNWDMVLDGLKALVEKDTV
jgi:uncharacterized protein YndB with AHSA1/START domain